MPSVLADDLTPDVLAAATRRFAALAHRRDVDSLCVPFVRYLDPADDVVKMLVVPHALIDREKASAQAKARAIAIGGPASYGWVRVYRDGQLGTWYTDGLVHRDGDITGR